MKLNMRTFAVSILSSGLLALGSSVAFADSVNNIDNTTAGESGHGAGCSNFIGGCNAPKESSTSGTYAPATGAGATTNANVNSDNTTPGESGHGTGCSNGSTNCSNGNSN